MKDSCCCKFFYLKEISFAVKGELPKFACEREHDIGTECNKSCPDFQQTRNQLACESGNMLFGSHFKFHFHKIIDLLYLLTPKLNRRNF